MRPDPSPATPMGGEGKTVELDETFIGRLEGQPKRQFGQDFGWSLLSQTPAAVSIASIPTRKVGSRTGAKFGA
jgi:hypothetical protein